MISTPELAVARAVWEFLAAGGIPAALLVLVWTIVQGKLVPRLHHEWVIAELQRDRDEWRDHAGELKVAIDRLAEARGRR